MNKAQLVISGAEAVMVQYGINPNVSEPGKKTSDFLTFYFTHTHTYNYVTF